MGVGQLSESDAVDALRLPFYSSSHPTGSHGWRNQFDLGNPDLYKYFSSKSTIYDELFRLAHHMFLEQVSEQVSKLDTDRASFWDIWTAVLKTQLDFAHSHPELFELGFQRPVPGFTPSEESLAISQVSAGQGEAIIRRAIESGEIVTELSLAQVRDILFAITGGLTTAHMANEPNVPPEQGRFGSLVGHALEIFKTAWGRDAHPTAAEQWQEGGS